MLRNQRGVTILEMVVAGGLLSVAGFMAVTMYVRAVEDAVLSQNNDAVAGINRQLDKMATKALNSMTVPQFDPRRTLIGNTDSAALLAVGTQWNLPGGVTVRRADVPQFTLAGFTSRSSSFDIENFILQRSGTDVNSLTRSIFLSRCVDREIDKRPEEYTIAEIRNLRIPYFLQTEKTRLVPDPDDPEGPPIEETYMEPDIHCCPRTATLDQPCPAPDDDELNDSHRLRFFPTIFVLQPDGGVSTIPSVEERHVAFGAAMQFTVDGNPPAVMMVQTAVMFNKCKTSRLGFEGRSPHKCVEPIFGVPGLPASYENFDKDIQFTFGRKTKDVARDVTGSSFIRMGTRTSD